MTLYQFAYLIKKHLIIICACALVCAAIGGAYAASQATIYTATTTFFCEADIADVGTDGTPIDPASANTNLARALCNVLNTEGTLTSAATINGLDDTSQYSAQADNSDTTTTTTTTTTTATAIIAITVTGPDEQMVIDLANTLYQQAYSTGIEVLKAKDITLLTSPEAPLEQDSTSVAAWALVGLIFGLLVSVIVIVVRDLAHPRLYAGAQAAALSELPLLGRIKRNKACDNDDDRLALNILFAAKDEPLKQLAVSSTDEEEDAQLVAKRLVGAAQRAGRGAHLVSAGSDKAPQAQEAAGEVAKSQAQEAAGEDAGLGIVAIPSVADVPKAALVAKDASGVVIVVTPGKTLRADFEDCVDELRLAQAKFYGICSLE